MKLLKTLGLLALIIIMASLTASAAGNKNGLVTRNYTVGNCRALEAAQGLRVEFRQAPTTSLSVTAPRYVFDKISVASEGNRIVIKLKDRLRKVNKADLGRVKIVMTAPNVKSFESSAAAVINITGELNSKSEIEFTASSAGIINAPDRVTAPSLEAEVSSAGVVNANGLNVDAVDAEASSGGVANLSGKSGKVKMEASTGAVINVTALEFRNGSAEVSTGAVINTGGRKLSRVEKSTGGAIN